jgi:hypothetical protein
MMTMTTIMAPGAPALLGQLIVYSVDQRFSTLASTAQILPAASSIDSFTNFLVTRTGISTSTSKTDVQLSDILVNSNLLSSTDDRKPTTEDLWTAFSTDLFSDLLTRTGIVSSDSVKFSDIFLASAIVADSKPTAQASTSTSTRRRRRNLPPRRPPPIGPLPPIPTTGDLTYVVLFPTIATAADFLLQYPTALDHRRGQ